MLNALVFYCNAIAYHSTIAFIEGKLRRLLICVVPAASLLIIFDGCLQLTSRLWNLLVFELILLWAVLITAEVCRALSLVLGMIHLLTLRVVHTKLLVVISLIVVTLKGFSLLLSFTKPADRASIQLPVSFLVKLLNSRLSFDAFLQSHLLFHDLSMSLFQHGKFFKSFTLSRQATGLFLKHLQLFKFGGPILLILLFLLQLGLRVFISSALPPLSLSLSSFLLRLHKALLTLSNLLFYRYEVAGVGSTFTLSVLIPVEEVMRRAWMRVDYSKLALE